MPWLSREVREKISRRAVKLALHAALFDRHHELSARCSWQNAYLDNPTYDEDSGELLTARLRTYASSGDVPDGTPLHTYNITITLDGDGRLLTLKKVD